MATVPTANSDGVSAVLDPTTHEVHLYDSGELQFSLSLAEADGLVDQLTTIVAASRPRAMLPCPAWCTTDHAKHAVGDDPETRFHTRTIGAVGGMDAIVVDVSVTDNLATGARSDMAVVMWGSGYGDNLDATQARLLSDVLLRAADFLEGHWSAS